MKSDRLFPRRFFLFYQLLQFANNLVFQTVKYFIILLGTRNFILFQIRQSKIFCCIVSTLYFGYKIYFFVFFQQYCPVGIIISDRCGNFEPRREFEKIYYLLSILTIFCKIGFNIGIYGNKIFINSFGVIFYLV